MSLHRWGEIWHEGPLLCAKFHPHGCNDKGIGPPKLKFLLRFHQNVYAYVRGGPKATKKVGPIVNNQGKLVDCNEGLCELLNQAFEEVFTKEDLSDIPEAKWEYSVNGSPGFLILVLMTFG